MINKQISDETHGTRPNRGGRVRRLAPCIASILLCLPTTAPAEADSHPNILWLIAEDLGPELGCYGTEQVWTPHLDRLAGEGVRYTLAFTTTPVCSTSRSSFMTGMYSTTIGTHHHRSHRNDGFQLPQGVRLLTDRLREVGYFTANIRKFDHLPSLHGTGKTDWNFSYPGRPFDSDRWRDLQSHQPFYAQVNFQETHRGKAWNTAHTRIPKKSDPAKVTLPPYYPDHPIVRRDWAQYLNTVMAMDAQVGQILDLLAQDGLADNTIVVFLGDHGRAHVRGKQWCYDSGLHIPLIVRWPKAFPPPRQVRPGSVDRRLIASIDLTATTLDIAGATVPKSMEGRIFLGPRAAPPRQYLFASRDRCDETTFRIRTVRDERFRYIRNFMPERPFFQYNAYKERQYPMIPVIRELGAAGKLTEMQQVLLAPHRPAEELYDTQADPYETTNLVDSAEHRDDLVRLRTALTQWIEETGDQGQIDERAP